MKTQQDRFATQYESAISLAGEGRPAPLRDKIWLSRGYGSERNSTQHRKCPSSNGGDDPFAMRVRQGTSPNHVGQSGGSTITRFRSFNSSTVGVGVGVGGDDCKCALHSAMGHLNLFHDPADAIGRPSPRTMAWGCFTVVAAKPAQLDDRRLPLASGRPTVLD